MVKKKASLLEEETLAEVVRRYPCIYDKADKGYKEKDRKSNAWKEIDAELGFKEG